MSPVESEETLLELLSGSDRGQRREGLFAVWLTMRVALDHGLTPPLPERAQRRRVDALERRLARLSLAAPLRRALAGTLALLRDGGSREAAMALHQLVVPVRETVGPEAGDVIARAARAARGK